MIASPSSSYISEDYLKEEQTVRQALSTGGLYTRRSMLIPYTFRLQY